MALRARFRIAAPLLAVSLHACAPAATIPLREGVSASGPETGTLVIAGGGALIGTGIMERFLELAGGPDAPIVVIPTADGDTLFTEDWHGLAPLRAAGATNVTILHTYDRDVADTDAFAGPLKEAKGVWITGGRQWRLADVYLGTETERELHRLLERGGVIGGSSAGASIQASFLVRGAPEGNHIVMSPEYTEGFGFLRNAAIDQHLLVRQRERDLLEILEIHPELLGIGIDESTAIVVRGNMFEVVGRSRVAVYDGTPRAGRRGYYFLSPGDRYDMAERSAYRADK